MSLRVSGVSCRASVTLSPSSAIVSLRRGPRKSRRAGIVLVGAYLICDQVTGGRRGAVVLAVPGGRLAHRGLSVPYGSPPELLPRLGAIQAQPMGLVRFRSLRAPGYPGTRTPLPKETLDHPAHRMIAGLVRGAEVPRTLVAAALAQHAGPEPEVAGERLQDMLPGTHGIGVAHDDRLAGRQGPHRVGDDPVSGPVATADDIAGAGRCHCRPIGKEAVAVRGRDQLRAALAGAVRIVATHGVRLAEGAIVFVVLVALVAGHDYDGSDRCAGAGRFERVHGSHHVGLEGLVGLRVRPQDQGLGGEVEDHRRPRGLHLGYKAVPIADVGDHVLEPRA